MRLATDLSCHRADVPIVPLLRPFVDVPSLGDTAWDRRFDRWCSTGAEHHELVDDLETADLVVVPTDWYWVRGPSWASRPDRALGRRLGALHSRARDSGVATLVHFTGDRSCDGLGLDGPVVLREGAFRSRRGPRDLVLPAFAEDLVEEHLGGVPAVRSKCDRPVVGFCGLATSHGGLSAAARVALYRLVIGVRERRIDPSPFLGETLRMDALEVLRASSVVETNFVVRDSSVFFRDASTSDLVDVRHEYVENLRSCDYVLCVRGSGNYSYRLYEALCMGRIPVIVDTDLALPFAEDIAWDELAVVVPRDGLDRIDQAVADHYRQLDDASFAEIQRRAREAWSSWLAPEAFYARLGELIANT